MSILVERVGPARLLRLPALGMASAPSVLAAHPLPTARLSEPFPSHQWQRARLLAEFSHGKHGSAVNPT